MIRATAKCALLRGGACVAGRIALSAGLAALLVSCAAAESRDAYPLSPEMVLVAKDASSPAYRASLEKFHLNDLHSEWQRAFGPDGPESFARAHGGVEALSADPQARKGYRSRDEAAKAFLALLRAEYARRKEKAPFDEGAKVESSPARAAAAADDSLSIEPILPAANAAANWPRWRGPGGQGVSTERNAPLRWSPDENIAWRTDLPGQGNSSPIIWEDRIYLTTAFDEGRRRSLVCIQRRDGAIQFVKDAPLVAPEGRVIAKNGYASATPVTDGERVIAFFGNTGLVAFDLQGKLLWHYPFPPFDAMHGTGASPVICGDLAILFQEQSSKPSIGVAVDKKTGNERWRIERTAALGWSTPLPVRAGGREQLLYGGKEAVFSFDPLTGQELWRCAGPTYEVIPTVVCGHGLVFSSSGRNGPTIAVRPDGSGDVTATHLAWSVVRGAPHVPSPVLSNGLLYQANDTGVLSCIDARKGETVYQKRIAGRFSASPVAASGRIYFTNEDGETLVISEGRELKILATNPLGEPVLASPAFLGGRIYMRGQKHLFAIGLTDLSQ